VDIATPTKSTSKHQVDLAIARRFDYCFKELVVFVEGKKIAREEFLRGFQVSMTGEVNRSELQRALLEMGCPMSCEELDVVLDRFACDLGHSVKLVDLCGYLWTSGGKTTREPLDDHAPVSFQQGDRVQSKVMLPHASISIGDNIGTIIGPGKFPGTFIVLLDGSKRCLSFKHAHLCIAQRPRTSTI